MIILRHILRTVSIVCLCLHVQYIEYVRQRLHTISRECSDVVWAPSVLINVDSCAYHMHGISVSRLPAAVRTARRRLRRRRPSNDPNAKQRQTDELMQHNGLWMWMCAFPTADRVTALHLHCKYIYIHVRWPRGESTNAKREICS